MKEKVRKEASWRAKRGRRRWQAVTACLCMAAVLLVGYALLLPAATLTADCGLIEHIHTSDCYDGETLLCPLAEHIHIEDCYGSEMVDSNEIAMENEAPSGEMSAEEGPLHNGETSDDVSPLKLPVEDTVVATGDLTETITWTITKDQYGKQTLTISGTGAMPDFSSADQQPWRPYSISYNQVVIECGITHIGDYAFNGHTIWRLELPEGLLSIGDRAFWFGNGLKEVTIPDTVTTIGWSAFFNQPLEIINLGNGVQKIGSQAFWDSAKYTSVNIFLPASVIFLGENVNTKEFSNFVSARSYTVAEDNPSYMSIDGVLYNKNGTKLLEYPMYKEADNYTIPSSVTSVASEALQWVKRTRSLYIPNTIKSLPSVWAGRSNFEEITIEEGVALNGNSDFYQCASLKTLNIPKDTYIRSLQNFVYKCYNLESLLIPSKTVQIVSLGDGLNALQKITYNAENAKITQPKTIFGSTKPAYHLTIDTDVAHLPAGFYGFVTYATGIDFLGPNQFTVEAGAFAGAGEPLESLSGPVYVDAQGALYTYDAAAGTAALAYCPPGAAELTIPASIELEDSAVCAVTGVGVNACKQAKNLTAVTFAAPEAVKEIAAYGFANCPTLTSVNGQTTLAKAQASFPNAQVGYNAFYNTGLSESAGGETDLTGKQVLNVSSADGKAKMQVYAPKSEGGTCRWEAGADGGRYKLLTGDQLFLAIQRGNVEGNQEYVCRLYLQLTNDTGNTLMKPGESRNFNGVEVSCHGTEDPNTVYLEFNISEGIAVEFSVPVGYPSPSSAGGGLIAWGVILTQEEAENSGERLVDAACGTINAQWTTRADEFALTKTAINANSAPVNSMILSVVSDGKGGVKLNGNLGWKVTLSRAEETVSAYGKDYIQTVDFTDRMTLPQGLDWTEDVKTAIQKGNLRRVTGSLYAGETRILNLAVSSGHLELDSICLTWDEAENAPVLSWQVRNAGQTTELGACTATLHIYPEAVTVDPEMLTKDVQVENHAAAQVHYHYSDAPQPLEAQAAITVRPGQSQLTLTKTGASAVYYGEPITYTLTMSNPGAAAYEAGNHHGVWTLADEPNDLLYFSPSDMERMFEEDGKRALTITITRADLQPWKPVQGIYEGTAAWTHENNAGSVPTADPGNTYGSTVVIGWNDDKTALQVAADETVYPVGEGGLDQALREAGYTVTRWSQYKAVWALNPAEEDFVLPSGASQVFHVYAHAKDTFHLETKDWLYTCLADSVVVTNQGRIRRPNGSYAAQRGVSTTVKREAFVEKWVSRQGELLHEDFEAANGDVLDYTLSFTHYGGGDYENLPMTDDLCGAQALLVPVDKNPDLADLTVQPVDGTDYYVLRQPGTYRNVVVGQDDEGRDCIADTITVSQDGGTVDGQMFTGLHTKIKWYFAHLEGGDAYEIQVYYKALVELDLSNGNGHDIGNVVWMNDRQDGRIFWPIWGRVDMLDFDKEILTERGVSPAQDKVVEDGFSVIDPGQSVTYRLTLRNTANGVYYVNGLDFADGLPSTGGAFSWTKDNVRIQVVSTHDDTQYQNLDGWTIADSWGGFDPEKGQQYIVWPEDAEITFHTGSAKVYLYVTLTFPAGELWDAYSDAIQGGVLENTFYVYHFPANVTHQLREPGKVLLQKGVYALGNYSGVSHAYSFDSNRIYYNNKDSRNRSAVYYVFLYNGGYTRLYLNDLYDRLPTGFTYRLLTSKETGGGSHTVNRVTTEALVTDYQRLVDVETLIGDTDFTYRTAVVEMVSNSGGIVQFHLSGGGTNPIRYDGERDQYYLDTGEAVVFGYYCDIGLEAQTEDIATNAIAMPYTDYLGGGVTVVGKDQVSVTGHMGRTKEQQDFTDANDGGRRLESAAQVEQDYGFQDGGGNSQWLVSDVTVRRGSIIPGVTKFVDSYTYFDGTKDVTQDYVNSVYPSYLLNWRVRLQNSGTRAISDWTFTDVLPAPYVLEGDIVKTTVNSQGITVAAEKSLYIAPHTSTDESVEITCYGNNRTYQVMFDGNWFVLSPTTGLEVAISRDEHGNEVLKIGYHREYNAIPENGGYVDLTFSSRNPTDEYRETVFTNRAYLTPNQQSFDLVGQGSKTTDLDGNPAVMNTAPVTVAFGFATTSEKRVTQADDSTNTAVSNDPAHNYILLLEADKEFVYSLTVRNDTQNAMTKLIFLDNLPEIGDHSPFDAAAPRGSAFRVSLAENPDVTVTVTPREGEAYILNSGDYQVEYQTGTDFTADDWAGKDTGVWTDSSTNARSLRVKILDGTGTKIPAGAVVTVSFRAKADGEAQPGDIAWNSFGYHYGLMDVTGELEAMPLAVGVKLPAVPALQKKLVDQTGAPVAAEQNTPFSFLVYEGEALNGTYDTEEELRAALTADNRNYWRFNVTVPAGESASERINLDGADWRTGAKYTVVELPAGEDYAFHDFNNLPGVTYTFTHSPDQPAVITCQNVSQRWSIQLTKVNHADHATLPGAVFALYSPDAADRLDTDGMENPPETTVTIAGKTWYLTAVETTGETGILRWDNLRRENYYVLEVQAPAGYALLTEPIPVNRASAKDGIADREVENYATVRLPDSGGPGVLPVMLPGAALLTCAAAMLLRRRKRKTRAA